MASTEETPLETPVPESEVALEMEDIADILKNLKDKIKELEEKLNDKESPKYAREDANRLKPIDIKDIEMPDKYDHNISKFNTWFDKFRDLLTNRHTSWYKLLEIVEKNGKNTIRSQQEFFDNINDEDNAGYKNIKEQADMYAYQLKSYLRTYTDGELHARVVQTDSSCIMELMREIIYKGRNRNPNKLIDVKSKALSPPRAHKVSETNKILTDWKHVRQCIIEEDKSYKMDDETMQTILLKIMPQEYVKDMRDKLTEGKYRDDYHGFEQELFDEVSTRKMDEESRKTGGTLAGIKNQEPTEEYEEVEVWSEEWQCNIFGLAQKRDRSRSRSRGGEDEDEERPAKQERRSAILVNQGDSKGGKGKTKGSRPAGPCRTCGGEHFQRDCTQSQAGKGNYPISTAWSSWRPGAYPGPTSAQWNSWLPKPWKGKGKGKGGKGDKGKGKGKGFNKGKGKGQNHDGNTQSFGSLGELQQMWEPQHQR